MQKIYHDPIHSDSAHVVKELSLLVNHLNSLQSLEISIDETLLYHPGQWNRILLHRGQLSKIVNLLSFGSSALKDSVPQTICM